MGTYPNQYGVSRKHIIASCEASLRRLKTDHIDLYYIHGPDPVGALRGDYARSGRSRAAGQGPLPGL